MTAETPSPGTAIARIYNGLQLATQTESGATVKFFYDAYGNLDCRTAAAYGGGSCPVPGSVGTLEEDWVYDYKNRLAGYRTYDTNGNAVSVVDYVNDPFDRPVKETLALPGPSSTYEFTYVGAGDLLSKEIFTGGASVTIGGRTRIPDALTSTTLSEIKNVGSLSYTRQLREYAQYAQQTGRTFDLYVRHGTRISGPLQRAADLGELQIIRALP